MDGGNVGDTSMIPKPRLDGTVQLGQLINSGLLVALAAFLYGMISWKADVDTKLTNVQAIPGLVASDKLQDERIAGFARTLDNVVQKLDSTNEAIGKIGTSVAVIEERTKQKAN